MRSTQRPSVPEEGLKPSKSQRKRESTALQILGQQLTQARPQVLQKCQLPEPLLLALQEYQRLPDKHGAERRQRQFIGRLMRDLDEATIARIHQQLNLNVALEKRRFHRLEDLRDQLLQGDAETLQQALQSHPELDAKQLGQLLRQTRKEMEQSEAPPTARKLFRYLRDTLGV